MPAFQGITTSTDWIVATFGLVALAVFPDSSGNPPREFDHYWIAFLERGDDPPAMEASALECLQRRHLIHLHHLHRAGHAIASGPFEMTPDDPLRGIVLLRGDLSREEATQLCERDPAVQAGRLKVRLRRWSTGAGSIQVLPSPLSGSEPAGGE